MELVAERETCELTVAELADRAGLSRQAVYLHYPDADRLLLAAAVDLLESRVLSRLHAGDPPAVSALVLAQHFAAHRAFYRAVLAGHLAQELNRRLFELLQPFNTGFVRSILGDLPEQLARDLGAFLTGGTEKMVTGWITAPVAEFAGPEEFADRLVATLGFLARPTSPAGLAAR